MSEWPDEIIEAGSRADYENEGDGSWDIADESLRDIYRRDFRVALDAAVGAGLLEHLLKAQGWEKGGTEDRLMQEYPGQRPARFTRMIVGTFNGRQFGDHVMVSGALPRVWTETRQRWFGPWRSVVESTGE